MALQPIGKMSLKNQGGFVTRIMFKYLDDNGEWQLSKHSGGFRWGVQGSTLCAE